MMGVCSQTKFSLHLILHLYIYIRCRRSWPWLNHLGHCTLPMTYFRRGTLSAHAACKCSTREFDNVSMFVLPDIELYHCSFTCLTGQQPGASKNWQCVKSIFPKFSSEAYMISLKKTINFSSPACKNVWIFCALYHKYINIHFSG